MKTKLKVGDKVYDSALFGDLEGIVQNIAPENYDGHYKVIVAFGVLKQDYTLDGRNYSKFNPTLSMQPYDKLSEIVPVWEEEEVWGLFWDENYDRKEYGSMVKSDNEEYPYRVKGFCYIYKHFKETGKLI